MNSGDMRKIVNLMEAKIEINEEADLVNNPNASGAGYKNVDEIFEAINQQLSRVGLHLATTNMGDDNYWYDIRNGQSENVEEVEVITPDDEDEYITMMSDWYSSDWKDVDEVFENIQKDLAKRGHAFLWEWLGSEVVILIP